MMKASLLVEVPNAPSGVGPHRRRGVCLQKIVYYLTSKWSILMLYLSGIQRLVLPHTGYAYGRRYTSEPNRARRRVTLLIDTNALPLR